jgi:DNA-binding winged helix-turn-helix (wHTH) protein
MVVSDTAVTTRINAARSAIGDSGEEQRLIKMLPSTGVRFVGSSRTTPPSPFCLSPISPAMRSRTDYFIDGIVEDIITELSRFGELSVIARNSSEPGIPLLRTYAKKERISI